MDVEAIPLKGGHIRKVTVKRCGITTQSVIQERGSQIAINRDWYMLGWQFCCIRPKELGEGHKTDWIVYYVNKQKYIDKIKDTKKLEFTDWFNVLKFK
jgi:hypothetical protein